MKVLRTIIWVLAALGFLVFATYNWQPVELRLWQNLVLETKVPVLALLAFSAGFLPMWAVHRSVVWSMSRRVRTLENSLKNTTMAHRADVTTAANASHAADSPVEKPGKSGGEESEPFDISDTGGGAGTDGGSAGE